MDTEGPASPQTDEPSRASRPGARTVAVSALALGLALAMIVAIGDSERGRSGAADAKEDGASVLTWREPIEVASGPAHVGPWRMNESDWRYVDDPTVAVDERGRTAVAWVDQARKDVFFQLYGSNGELRLPEPVNVSRSPEIFSWLPRIVMTSEEPPRIYLLWQEIVFSGGTHGGEAFFARSTDGGRSFGDPVNLSDTPAGVGKGRLAPGYWHNGSLALTRGTGGELYAAWTEYEGRLWVSRSPDGGRSFSEPVLVAGGSRAAPARGPALAVGAGTRVYLAWTVGDDPAADIRLAVSEDGGRRFGEPRVVHASESHADAPVLAVGREGTLHLAYGMSPSGPLASYHIRYSRSGDGGATFEEPRDVSASHSGAFESVNFPDLGLDAGGDPYLLWHVYPDGHERPRGLGITYSMDGGRTFGPPSLIPGTMAAEGAVSGSLQGLLVRKLAVSPAGEIAVVNSTFRRNQGSRVRLIRGRIPR